MTIPEIRKLRVSTENGKSWLVRKIVIHYVLSSVASDASSLYAVLYYNLDSLLPRLEHFPVKTAFDIVPVHTLVSIHTFESIDTSSGAEWL
jgi:hypothetical protein